VLEVLDSWEAVVEIAASQALERLGAMLSDGTVRPEQLAKAAATEPARVRERLRLVLEFAGQAKLANGVRPVSKPFLDPFQPLCKQQAVEGAQGTEAKGAAVVPEGTEALISR